MHIDNDRIYYVWIDDDDEIVVPMKTKFFTNKKGARSALRHYANNFKHSHRKSTNFFGKEIEFNNVDDLYHQLLALLNLKRITIEVNNYG